jgi:DNA-binding response OmpR family regulator
MFQVQIICEIASPQQGSSAATKLAEPAPTADRHRPANAQMDTSPLLLLIEDDTELRQFLRASLPAHYRMAEAADGEEGIRMALELVPDLIVSDWVMPQKDGLEVADMLKNSAATSHIPLILLTAKSSLDSKLQGLRRGADAYLSKPFQADELVAHIESLLASRQRLQAYFSQISQKKSMVESATATFSAEENEFLQRLTQIVEENLDNEAMDADAFAKMMFVSRSQMHRKISALMGLSLTEFVRNHRLDRARDMLARREGSISEIAWRTGFPNAKYFSTCFKERFGETPSAYISG